MAAKFRKVCRNCGEEKGDSISPCEENGDSISFCHQCHKYTKDKNIEKPAEDIIRTPKPEYPIRIAESYTPPLRQERKTRFISWPVEENFHNKYIDIEKLERETAKINAEIEKIDPETRKFFEDIIREEQERQLKITREMNTKFKKHRKMFERNMDSVIESIVPSIYSVYPSVEFDYRGVSTTEDYSFKFDFFITFPKDQLDAEEFENFICKKGYYIEDQIHGLIPEKIMNPKVDGINNKKSRENYNQYIITFENPATAYNHLVKE